MSFTTYGQITADFRIDGFISYQTGSIGKDQYPAALAADNNFMYDGTASVNKSGKQLTDANFASLNPVNSYTRDAEGNIIWGDFLKFIPFEEPGPGTQPEPEPEPETKPSPGPSATPAPSASPGPTAAPDPTSTPSPAAVPNTGGSGSAIGDSSTTVLLLDGSVRIELPITVDAGKASALLMDSSLQKIIALAKADSTGNKTIRIPLTVDPAKDIKEYELRLPASAFRSGASALQIEVSSSLATIMLPDSLFPAAMLDGVKTITVLVRTADTEGPLKGKLGDSPLIGYELRLDGIKLQADSLQSAIQIGLPHSPAVPAADNAFIVVWHVNDMGIIQPVISGDYNAERQQAIFSTTLSSGHYAAVYNHKTFQDISHSHWAKSAVEVLTSKGVINGISETEFRPDQAVTRAEFALLLVRALGLSAAEGGGFADGASTRPNEPLSRQEMFVMAARALQAAEVWNPGTIPASGLDSFTDRHLINIDAADDIAALAAAGLIKGDGRQQLKPTAYSTRAEAAMLIYRILMRN